MIDLEPLKVPTLLADGFSVNGVYALVSLLLVFMTWLAVRAPGLKQRLVAVSVLLLTIPTVLIAGMEQLSLPKPLSFAWVSSQPRNEIVLLAAPIIRQRSERVEMLVDVKNEARFFWMPLTDEVRKSLQKALEEWENGRRGSLRLRIEPSWKKVPPMFYTLPWPAPPPKDIEEQKEPHRFKNDA